MNPSSFQARLLVLVLALPLAACTGLVEDIGDHLAARSLEGRHELLLFEGDLAAFRGCLRQTGGTCPDATARALQTNATPASAGLSSAGAASLSSLPEGHPARLAHAVLAHPAMRQAVDLHNHLRGHGSGSLESDEGGVCSKIHVPISTSHVTDLHDHVLRATAADGWDALYRHTRSRVAAGDPSRPDHGKKESDARKAKFLKTYVEAFFGNGHILSVRFDVTRAEAESYISKELGRHARTTCAIYNAEAAASGPETGALGSLADVEEDLARLSLAMPHRHFAFRREPSADEAADQAASKDCASLASSIYDTFSRIARDGASHHTVKVAQAGFISRDADFAAQIPSIAIDVDPLAEHRHAVTLEMKPAKPNGKLDYTALGTDLVRVVLEAVFDAHQELPAASHSTAAAHRLLPPISTGMSVHLDRMNRINDTAQLTAGIMVDRVIQGIGPLSLNNDALEALITTLVSTSVRKAVEKATWCWYACNLNEDVDHLYRDARADVDEEKRRIEEDVKRHALDAAKHVCLALDVRK